MNQASQQYTPDRTARLLHGAFTAGCVLAGGVFYALRAFGQGPRVEGDVPIGMWLAIAGVLLVVVATTLIRRRVPERVASQSAEEFWSTPATITPAMVMWSMIEGGALLSLVGYLLTGDVAPAAVAVGAIATLAALRPGRLEVVR
jgi:drug/metabolite transporter (DMT)-like permease